MFSPAAASYAGERTNASWSERAISMIILFAPLHKMTIIYLQELIGLAINVHESMTLKSGALKAAPASTASMSDGSASEGLY